MNKKYFFFDIDGTLLSEIDKQFPESCKYTLTELEKRGHFVAMATSRPYCLTVNTAREVGIKNYVSDGGDGIVLNNQVIALRPLNLEDCLALAKECLLAKLPIATSIDTTNNRYCLDDTFTVIYPRLKNAFHFVTKEDFNVFEAKTIHKMCILCPKEKEYLIPSLSKVPHYRIDEHCILVEAVYKYEGIKEMMNLLNAPLEDVVVFGDGINDLDMLSQAPLSIAMGNAKDEVKAIASYVSDKASLDGIYKACLHFNWINEML